MEGAVNDPAPIFVDVSPERFPYILDWYRDGEINIPATVSLNALLMDAKYLRLPSEVVVNGIPRAPGANLARRVSRTLFSDVARRWSGFEDFLEDTVKAIKSHFRQVADDSCGSQQKPRDVASIRRRIGSGHPDAGHDAADAGADDACDEDVEGEGEEEEPYDFPPFVIPLYGEDDWVDSRNICSAARARVVAVKLEQLGFVCDFSEHDILVSLPSRLKNEQGACDVYDEDVDDEEVDMLDEGEEGDETAGGQDGT